jgi:lysozyme
MILGTDISKWEDDPSTPKKIDFNIMKSAGAQFCIFKASQAQFTDKVFQISWGDCKGVMPRGAYHYLDYSISGLKQAEYFCNVIANDPPEIPPIVDFECRVNIPSKPNGELWNFVSYVEKTTGRIPIIYSSPSYWKEFGSSNYGWHKFPLWIANYRVNTPTIPAPWTEYLFWQFTDRGDGKTYGVEAKMIDLNWFNGTQEDLDKLCGVTPPSVPLTLQQKVDALYEQGKSHGWTLP